MEEADVFSRLRLSHSFGNGHQGWHQKISDEGADSSNEGTKIWFSGYYKYKKSPKNRSCSSDGGLVCSHGRL